MAAFGGLDYGTTSGFTNFTSITIHRGSTVNPFSQLLNFTGSFITHVTEDFAFLDEFTKALAKCEKAFAGLLIPMLRALRRARRLVDDLIPSRVAPAAWLRRSSRSRAVRHGPCLLNNYKVKV